MPSRYANELRAFGLVLGRYRELTLPDRRLWLPEAGIGIGVWPGRFEGIEGEWLRCYDEDGRWLPIKSDRQALAEELAEQEALRAERADQRAEQADQRAEQLASRLRALGIDPDA